MNKGMAMGLASVIGCVVLALLLGWGGTTVAAAQEFFPLADVRPGMWGVGKTVVEGTEIESFAVEVLAILENASASGTLIMVKVSGSAIERSGGVASGMSGSPVYIDGKLVGAISHGFASDPTIGMVTPIEDMMAVFRLAEADRDASRPATSGAGGDSADVPSEDVIPLQTPILVTGMGERSFNRLSDLLRPYQFVPTRTGGVPSSVVAGELEPGSALAVQYMVGDISMTTIGTLTYRDEQVFVAFGHAIDRAGAIQLMIAPAYIHRTILGFPPFKLGAALQPIGRATQDRAAGVAGVLGELPPLTRLTVNVYDRDTRQRTTSTVEIVQHERLLSSLLGTAALEFVDRALDRIGSGTARVVVQFEGEGLPRRVVRDNLVYSAYDVGAAALSDAIWGVQLLLENEYQEVRLEHVIIDLDIEERRWTARILDVTPMRTRVLPGETLPVTVTVLPYRGEPEDYLVNLPIPEGIEPGELFVYVRGGWGYGSLGAEPDWLDGLGPTQGGEFDVYTPVDGLNELIDEFVYGEKAYEIVLEYYPEWSMWGDDSEWASDGIPSAEHGMEWSDWETWEPVTASVGTRYVVEGYEEFVLTVLFAYEDEGAEDAEA